MGLDDTSKRTNCYHWSVEHKESTWNSRKETFGPVPIMDSTAGPFGEMEENPREMSDIS